MFIDHPDIRPYFYDGKQLTAADRNRQKVQAVAELTLDAFEWIWYRRKRLNAEGELGWEAYILDTLASSQPLREHYLSRARWYPGITRLLRDHPIPSLTGP
ncbi:hypothetical protein ABZ570_23540 [Micromonospora sp. NPDC007271]|uniref:hypothetical protein n=1 Tax=Micromonospora sp. NPDC007271 TaxID=3154587 RepID=UPI0033EC46C3